MSASPSTSDPSRLISLLISSGVVTLISWVVGDLLSVIVILPFSNAGETIFLELMSLIIILDNDKLMTEPSVADELTLAGIVSMTLSLPENILFVGE